MGEGLASKGGVGSRVMDDYVFFMCPGLGPGSKWAMYRSFRRVDCLYLLRYYSEEIKVLALSTIHRCSFITCRIL